MALSNDLISQFVKATQDKPETNKESTAYGTIVVSDGKEYVKLDGSDLLTPISSTTVVHDGDRVIVTIKNHTAIVTGDLTNPSASDKDVQNIDKDVKEIGTKISEFEIVIADKVSTKQLEAEIARIEQLRVEELEATNAKIETLETKVAKVDEFEADIAKIDELEARVADIDTLEADIATFKNTTTEDLEAMNAVINNLDATYVSVDELEATNAEVSNLKTNKLDVTEANAKYATIENLNSANAEIGNLKTNKLDTTEANAKYATIENLDATNANVTELNTKKLDAESAKLIYANIDFSNIKEAAIEKLFTDSGIIKDLIMSDGKVTGELVGVTIKGDLIEGNTLKADKLVILGTDGLYYKLNVDALGETTASADEKYQNGLDGSVIIAKSITADRVAVTDLVAFGATIGGFNITNTAIYSGSKASATNTTTGIYQGKDGQFAVGDDVNFVKFYKNQNGDYTLEISADNISFGAEKKTVESLYEAVNTNSENLTSYIEATNKELADLQGQIDGSIMTWFKEYAPLPFIDNKANMNEPAKTWIETDRVNGDNNLKNNHLGDLFYDTITGYCYRWQVLNNEYFWNRITDVDVTKALADAAKAQDTADNKRRVFVDTPTTPYDVGDLWAQGTSGDLMRCKTAKTKDQSYASADWVKASKYTDDTAVNALGTRVTAAETQITQNKNDITLRATKTEVTEQVNTINTNLTNNYYNKTQTDAKIKVESDKIALQATKIEETNAKIDNLEIGGRNLIIQNLFVNNVRLPMVTYTTDYTISDQGYVMTDKIYINPGEVYVLSAQENITGYLALGYFREDNLYMVRPIMHTTFDQKYTDIITIPDGYSYCRISFMKADKDFIKFEKGNKFTDWTPAPEDTQSDIDSININLSTNYYTKTESDAKLQVESDRITSTVNKLTTVETTANTAKSTADTAKTTATNAATTAGEAKTAASNAQSTADSATTKANNAQTAAENAQDTADTAQANVTALTTRVTSAETKIDQNADAIALRATKTEVEQVKTTATNAQNAINNLEVGGRNLLLNASGKEKKGFFQNFPFDENGEAYFRFTSPERTSGIYYGNYNIAPGFTINTGGYEPGEKVTWSYDIMYTEYDPTTWKIGEHWIGQRYTTPTGPIIWNSSVAGVASGDDYIFDKTNLSASGHTIDEIDVNQYVKNGSNYYAIAAIDGNTITTFLFTRWLVVTQSNIPYPETTGMNKWYHHTVTMTIPSTRCYPAPGEVATGVSFQFSNNALYASTLAGRIRNVKLERGTKETDWSPAPEDITNELTTNYYTKTQTDAQIKVASDSINLTVSSVKTTAETAKSTADSANTKAVSAQSTASEAKTTATTANNNANNAISTANTANSTANTAKSTADTAKSTAESAQTTATSAQTAATNAQAAADAAQDDIDNLEIGGRNIVFDSDDYIETTSNNSVTKSLNANEYNNLRNKQIAISVDIELTDAVAAVIDSGYTRIGSEFNIKYTDGTIQYCGVWHWFTDTAETLKTRLTKVVQVNDKEIEQVESRTVGIYIQNLGSGTAKIGRLKIEKGNRATDWTPAPEDATDDINDLADTLTNNYYTKAETEAAIKVEADNITAAVDRITTLEGTTKSLEESVSMKMDASSFNLAVEQKLANGVNTVKTSTGFTFDEDGLTIKKTDSATRTNIDEDGMDIIRNSDEEKVLVADENGVTAFNLWAKTYLIIGETSRLEDYTKNSKKRTGCFWIGE